MPQGSRVFVAVLTGSRRPEEKICNKMLDQMGIWWIMNCLALAAPSYLYG